MSPKPSLTKAARFTILFVKANRRSCGFGPWGSMSSSSSQVYDKLEEKSFALLWFFNGSQLKLEMISHSVQYGALLLDLVTTLVLTTALSPTTGCIYDGCRNNWQHFVNNKHIYQNLLHNGSVTRIAAILWPNTEPITVWLEYFWGPIYLSDAYGLEFLAVKNIFSPLLWHSLCLLVIHRISCSWHKCTQQYRL